MFYILNPTLIGQTSVFLKAKTGKIYYDWWSQNKWEMNEIPLALRCLINGNKCFNK